MQLVKPSEISSKIMTLIEESNSKLILVSPYVKVSKWYKLKNKLASAKQNGIGVKFYIRDDEENIASLTEVEAIGIKPILVPNMHCKLYMNDTHAIITSMNLLLSSEINSLEIGYMTDTKEEYEEVSEYYNRYLKPFDKCESVETVEDAHWLDAIKRDLDKEYGRLKIENNEKGIAINTGINNYTIFLHEDNGKKILRMHGIISSKQLDVLSEQTKNIESKLGLRVFVQKGAKGHYDLIWGESKMPYIATSIHSIPKHDFKRIGEEVKSFIIEIDNWKRKI